MVRTSVSFPCYLCVVFFSGRINLALIWNRPLHKKEGGCAVCPRRCGRGVLWQLCRSCPAPRSPHLGGAAVIDFSGPGCCGGTTVIHFSGPGCHVDSEGGSAGEMRGVPWRGSRGRSSWRMSRHFHQRQEKHAQPPCWENALMGKNPTCQLGLHIYMPPHLKTDYT